MTAAAVSERRLVAVLRLLRAGGRLRPAEGARARVAGKDGRVLLRVAAEVAAALDARDLVDADGAIAPLGLSFLRRAEGGEQGFLHQQVEIGRARVETAEGQASVLVDLGESPLGWLRRRKGKDGAPMLDDAQFGAGERLRADATRAAMLPRTTANWEATVAASRRADGMEAFTDGTIAARERVQRALAAVGPELSGVLLDVCCFLKGLETVERDRHWPARTARVVLGLALTRLAGHYGIGADARGPERARMAAWRAAG